MSSFPHQQNINNSANRAISYVISAINWVLVGLTTDNCNDVKHRATVLIKNCPNKFLFNIWYTSERVLQKNKSITIIFQDLHVLTTKFLYDVLCNHINRCPSHVHTFPFFHFYLCYPCFANYLSDSPLAQQEWRSNWKLNSLLGHG